jgi:CheY-like chemotaxis protein
MVQTASRPNSAGRAQALNHLARWTPDVLVSDIGMPGEDGHALIQRVRALPRDRGGRVPAAVLTDEFALVIARLAGLIRPPAS